MNKHKIFLASSSELKEDRQQFEIFISRKNKEWHDRGVFLELTIWEDFLGAISPTRLQDEYDQAVRQCDIFVLLFCTKVGKYTEEEFDIAYNQFKNTNKPLIYTYLKDAAINTGNIDKNGLKSLLAFQEKLENLGHFYTVYKNTDELILKFNQQLEKLDADGFFKSGTNTVQTNPKIPHALTKPPFLPEVFLGRTEELQTIKEKLFSGNHLLLLVNGEGGIGKTTLAANYFHTYQHEYAHVAWVLSEKNIADALLSLAGPLGLQFEETATADVRLEILLQAMAQLEKTCLLVIDNANEPEDLEKNYQNLRCCSNFHILLTTRITEFGQAERYRIEGLPEAQALELFKKYYPEHQPSDDGLFQQIRAAVGGNTLVVELLAKNLHQLNRHRTKYTLANLMADLQNKGLLALSQSQTVDSVYHAGSGIRKEKPEDIIAAIYDLSQLHPSETVLLSVFAVLPAESIRFDMLESLLTSTDSLEENLLALARKGWIEFNQITQAYKCSPVIQEILKKKNPNLFEDCLTLIDTLIDKLDYEPGTGHFMNATYEDAASFAKYAESVAGAFMTFDYNLAILCERTGNYHYTTGNLDKALRFYEDSTKINKELLETDPNNMDFKNGLAISYSKLGDTHTTLGNLDKALGFFEERSKLGKELYEAFPNNVSFKNGLAISYSKLGDTHTALGNLDKALEFFEEDLKLTQELYEAFPNNVSFKNGLAISYSKLGNTHTTLGNLDKALGFFEEDLKLTQELYEAFPNNVDFKNGLAISFCKLGLFFKDQKKNKKKAGDNFRKAKILWVELVRDAPGFVEFQRNLDNVRGDLKGL
jgi:tetratricopeptide (TPR) repeat protein